MRTFATACLVLIALVVGNWFGHWAARGGNAQTESDAANIMGADVGGIIELGPTNFVEIPRPPSSSTSSGTLVTKPCIDQFPRLPGIAARLGVSPANSRSAEVVFIMCDGSRYDFLELLDAFLDRLDRAAAQPSRP